MENNQSIEERISLTFDFVTFLWENPKYIDKIPNGATIKFIELKKPGTQNTVRTISSIPNQNTQYVKVRNAFELV